MKEIIFFILGGLTMTCIMCCIQINDINNILKIKEEESEQDEI